MKSIELNRAHEIETIKLALGHLVASSNYVSSYNVSVDVVDDEFYNVSFKVTFVYAPNIVHEVTVDCGFGSAGHYVDNFVGITFDTVLMLIAHIE